MKLIVVLSLCALAAAYPSNVQRKSPMEQARYEKLLSMLYRKANLEKDVLRGGRIVGGSVASDGQFPFQVYGYFDDEWLCGGSIFHKNFVLTAGHCVYQITFVNLYFGSIYRFDPTPHEQLILSSNFTLHSGYNDNSLVNDIALIRTDDIPIDSGHSNIGLVRLPSRAEDRIELVGYIGTTSGFGRFSDNSQYTAAELLFVEAPIISNAQCAQTFGPYVTETNICKDGYQGRGSCGGDSGGPMTVFVNGRSVQVGVVSYGAASGCQRGYPSVYTRVSRYIDWIQDHTGLVLK